MYYHQSLYLIVGVAVELLSTSATASVSAIYAYQLPSVVRVIATASPPTVTSGEAAASTSSSMIKISTI